MQPHELDRQLTNRRRCGRVFGSALRALAFLTLMILTSVHTGTESQETKPGKPDTTAATAAKDTAHVPLIMAEPLKVVLPGTDERMTVLLVSGVLLLGFFALLQLKRKEADRRAHIEG